MVFLLQDEVLAANPLPGYNKVERLAQTLTNLALEEGRRLTVPQEVAGRIVTEWEELDDIDKVREESLYDLR